MDNTKVKKKSKRISLKKVYAEVNHREFSNIINVKDQFILRSNFRNFLVENLIEIVIVSVVFLVLLVIAFWKTPLNLLWVLLFVFAVIVYAIYSSTYSLRFTQKDLIIKYRFETLRVSYDDLFNVYLSKGSRAGLTRFYSLNVIYKSEKTDRFIKTTLPTYALNHQELLKFFENLDIGHEFDKKYNAEEEKKEKAELRRQASNYKASDNKIIFIFFAILAFLILLIIIGGFALLKK